MHCGQTQPGGTSCPRATLRRWSQDLRAGERALRATYPVYGGGGFGTITFVGRDALAVNLGDELYLGAVRFDAPSAAVPRPASRPASAGIFAWLQYNVRRLDGIVLRSHRRLETPLPLIQASDYYASVTLGLHTIYVTRGDGELLTATLP